MNYPIADLHCDLLSFLVDHPDKNYNSHESRTSYSQLKEGNVVFQALTIFSPSNASAYTYGKKQLSVLEHLLSTQPEKFTLFDPLAFKKDVNYPIQVALVFENAYSLCAENDKIDIAFSYLEEILRKFKNILYISLTWDLENRFGGGVGSKTGLKEDGKHLLAWLDKRKIAIDLSHASDFLVHDILEWIEKKSLEIPILASHSNSRSIAALERNLPDLFIKEIIQKKGLIGFNFFAPFIGTDYRQIVDHIGHISSLGGGGNICFGGDFFYLPSFSYLREKYGTDQGFFSQFPDSSCYPKAISLLSDHFCPSFLKKLSSENFQKYIQRIHSTK